jgi:CRP-like cAMP-binding protein
MATTAGIHPSHSLAKVEIFENCAEADRKRVEARCRWRKFQEGETIIDRDGDTHEVHFIVSGQVRVVDTGHSGREVSFETIDAGGIVGELAAIDGGERSASVVAEQPTVTGALDARTFRQVMADHPDVGLAMMRRLTRMVRQSSGRIMELSTLGAHNRVHAELLRLARKKAGADATQARLYPIPVHADLASRVATTRETVARVMSDLTKKGLLQRDGNALVLTDLDALADLVMAVRNG